jgi:spermidine synthase
VAQHRDEEPVDDELPGYRTDTGVVELMADEDRPGGWLLTLDRIGQSYVDLEDPTYLEFEYMQAFADAVESFFPDRQRLDVTHVGGGGLSFPRYLLEVRPGSSQIVLEPDAALTALVRARLPLPARSGIRVRPVAGRVGLGALANASADLVVLDAFAGGRVPGDLTTAEAFADAARVLRPGGLFVANIADGPPLDYTRRLLAGLRGVFGHILVRTDPAVRKKRFGNLVVAAATVALPTAELVRRAHGAMLPTTVLSGPELERLVATARPWTDLDSSGSPQPSELTWRIDGGW